MDDWIFKHQFVDRKPSIETQAWLYPRMRLVSVMGIAAQAIECIHMSGDAVPRHHASISVLDIIFTMDWPLLGTLASAVALMVHH